MKYFYWIKEQLIEIGFNNYYASLVNAVITTIVVLLLLLLVDTIVRKSLTRIFFSFAKRTKTNFDDYLYRGNFPKYLAHILPLIFLRALIPEIYADFPAFEKIFTKFTDVYIILLSVWIFRSIIKATRDFLKEFENFKDKPLDSFAQIAIIFLWFIGFFLIFIEVTGQDVLKFLASLGAVSAILLLIFKDSLLGFVASIQVSVNDMVRIGDWITLEKFGADGDVYEINLTTVKVRNFDNTISTIPTYALISDSFKNWRGMQNSGGRRIKRSIHIKAGSVRFLSSEEITELTKIQLIKDYLTERQAEINAYNSSHKIDKSILLNGRNQTNLGIFRTYCDRYLESHPKVNKELMIMCRHLPPT
ncbi:MAG: mechanosensitive ion channel, partial [Flavobacteriaceae bacterium]|nr:mechanosensitive ion channel [Flavobacteriaceae bacterium]